MEILLNCVWLVVGLSLISAWSVHAYRTQTSAAAPLLPSRRSQVIALLLLVILLFPVISLTDDIAMCTAPRDAERALRLHDPADGAQQAQAFLPSTMAWMDAVAFMMRDGSFRPIEEDAQLNTLFGGMNRPIESRPPPAAL